MSNLKITFRIRWSQIVSSSFDEFLWKTNNLPFSNFLFCMLNEAWHVTYHAVETRQLSRASKKKWPGFAVQLCCTTSPYLPDGLAHPVDCSNIVVAPWHWICKIHSCRYDIDRTGLVLERKLVTLFVDCWRGFRRSQLTNSFSDKVKLIVERVVSRSFITEWNACLELLRDVL